MNSLPISISSAAQRLAALPLRILALSDYIALKCEHRLLVELSAAQDAWYVHRDGETTGPERIEDILRRLTSGESTLAIVHASSLGDSDPEWQILCHRSWCSDRATVAVWVIGFWMLAVLFGWMLAGLV